MNARQHESHQDLLAHFDTLDVSGAAMDAIIVPTGRPAAYLRQAIAVAKERGVFLLLLCSLRSTASAAALEAKSAGVRALAIDTDLLNPGLVPTFATDEILRFTRFRRQTDTSYKRNLGLLIAVLAGWKRILFLDDDIELPNPADLGVAAGLLDEYPVVGLANEGMPDNSVVCHAIRDAGQKQDTFIGGGALAVGEAAFSSFFPNIYNEDWFFLMDGMKLRPSATTGTAIQKPYDPYRDARRARGEELGDTLAEGVFGLFDSHLGLAQATKAYWRDFLADRRRIIRDTIKLVQASPIAAAQQARMVDALKAAVGRSELITPDLCVRYLRAWQQDCVSWRQRITELRRDHHGGSGVEHAVEALGIPLLARTGGDLRSPRAAKRRSAVLPSVAPV
ncbi:MULTISPECIES: hypothetical protein [unclassified Amycolatopsis]|uniref:hypothetical protein n=1 Tax=unclassified Amycolatopsis TaxID=2618356 RepID=UPI002875D052|nr:MULTISPECIES: hypothetical protein [unclassified Amycolatopsis]MDS0136332.1 hypothetical protein [Amycolatopsis sp. 505]MDS0145847.1 hypothetical protein [Amycolatopsis sp. CM201R]